MKKLLVLVLLLGGCAINNVQDKSAQISPGMTADQVEAIMGTPMKRSFKEESEAWQYCTTGFAQDKYITVWLDKKVVYGLTSREGSSGLLCKNGFAEVDWGQVRNRNEINVNVNK